MKHPCVGVIISSQEGVMLDPDTGEHFLKVLLCDREKHGLFMVTLSHKLIHVPMEEP